MAKSDYKRYVPLDAPSWGHALLTVLGWLLVPSFAILSTVLFYMYEVRALQFLAFVCPRSAFFQQRSRWPGLQAHTVQSAGPTGAARSALPTPTGRANTLQLCYALQPP